MLAEGLHVRRIDEIVDFIAESGFNSLRLLFNMEAPFTAHYTLCTTCHTLHTVTTG